MQESGVIAEPTSLDLFQRKLSNYSPLTAADMEALGALPFKRRSLDAGSCLLREGEPSHTCPVLLSGFAFRHKMTPRGGRQIVAVKMPGDPLDFQSLYVARADHYLQALTRVEIAVLQNRDFERLFATSPNIARAVVVDILSEASIAREWLLNIGRRSGLERLAHLMCEIHFRLAATGSGLIEGKLPLTQEQLADLLGLSPVHVNRCIKTLERLGAIERRGRGILIRNLLELRDIAEFTDLYLHMGRQTEVGKPD